jgi:hypothetical protein
MGTRAQFYLYVIIAEKRILVYSAYSSYDGYQWVDSIENFIRTYFKARGGSIALASIISELEIKFGLASGFACDTDVNFDVDLIPITPCEDLDTVLLPDIVMKQYEGHYNFSELCHDAPFKYSTDESDEEYYINPLIPLKVRLSDSFPPGMTANHVPCIHCQGHFIDCAWCPTCLGKRFISKVAAAKILGSSS